MAARFIPDWLREQQARERACGFTRYSRHAHRIREAARGMLSTFSTRTGRTVHTHLTDGRAFHRIIHTERL